MTEVEVALRRYFDRIQHRSDCTCRKCPTETEEREGRELASKTLAAYPGTVWPPKSVAKTDKGPAPVTFTTEEEGFLTGEGGFIRTFYRKCRENGLSPLAHFKKWVRKNFMQKRPVTDIWELRAFNGKDNLEFINWYWKKIGGA